MGRCRSHLFLFCTGQTTTTASGRMHDGLDDKVEILDTRRGYQTGAAARTTPQPIQEVDCILELTHIG